MLTLDLSLHPLLEYSITTQELISLYHFVHKGPLDPDAPNGVCIGMNVSRSERTEIYRFMTNLFKSLESKTINMKREVYLFIIYYL